MSEERPTDLLSGLPRTRPHRRSSKRGARAESRPAPAKREAQAKPDTQAKRGAQARPDAQTKSEPRARKARAPGSNRRPKAKGTRAARSRLRQPAQPAGTPRPPSGRPPREPKSAARVPTGTELVGTAVQAVAELTEIGFALGARALRNALSRVPRP